MPTTMKSAVTKQFVDTEKPKLINRIVVLLDESDSMSTLVDAAKRALLSVGRKIDQASKEEDQESVVNVFRFNTMVNPSETIAEAAKSYRPNGMTALRDAVGYGIDALAKSARGGDEAFMVIVLTDGQENASRRYLPETIKELIEKYQAKGNWTFAFQVPPGGKPHILKHFGVPAGNIREWNLTEQGLGETTEATEQGLGSYFRGRSRGVKRTENFYTDLSHVTSRDLAKLTDLKARFKTLPVVKECEIKPFVEEETKKPYRLGSAYYQLTKPEKVQAHKQILIMEKNKKSVWGGDEARGLIGAPVTAASEIRVKPGNHSNFDIFVQSTSTNRKLVRGTKLLLDQGSV